MSLVPIPRRIRVVIATAVFTTLLLACSIQLSASDKKQKKKKSDPAAENANGTPIIPRTDQEQIDFEISEVLAAWQLGNVELMHKDYAEDVAVVNGSWTTPIMGWTKYAELYKKQRDTMQQVRLDRSNTFIWVNGSTAWACYQWDFSAVVGGEPQAARGQTTLIFEKRDTRWLIVHDHTNVVETAQPRPAEPATPATESPSAQKPSQ
jgi:ketosteroid isomerase-like protein